MFNGYNETPLISYNEYDQEREKKQENASKWSYGHDVVQPAQAHPNSRQSEFWPGKPNFLGIPNLVKCTCSGCYSSSESQSYQGDSTRHRPWLPRTFPVPLNGSTEPCKLPGYHQWDNVGHSNQGSGFPDGGGGGGGGIPPSQYLQDTGGKHSYYRQYQSRPEVSQPSVITSVKNVEFLKKQKDELVVGSPGPDAVFAGQNGSVVSSNAGYNLIKRMGSGYCDPAEKYSTSASYSVNSHLSRLPVVEPYIKAVPSLTQNRVPSAGHRNIKESLPQSYVDAACERKLCSEIGPPVNGEKKPRGVVYPSGMVKDGMEAFQVGQPPPMDLKNINYPLLRTPETQAGGHQDYYPRNNFPEVMKRDNHTPSLETRKDCAMGQFNQMPAADHYGRCNQIPKYLDPKASCGLFYPEKKLERWQENAVSCPPSEDAKNENVAVRLPRSTLNFNDPRFIDRVQNSFSYQNNSTGCRSYARAEHPYQGYNLQNRFQYPHVSQTQYEPRNGPQEMPKCGVDQLAAEADAAFAYDPRQQVGNEKAFPLQFYGEKNPLSNPAQVESPCRAEERPDATKSNYLETIRSEEVAKSGTSKISPLRLLRKKKFVTQGKDPVVEPIARPNPDVLPALDVRKFLSTWAEEEEECVAPTQMVVLDCQNIDPEQAKLLHLYESEHIRGVHLESGSVITVRDSDCEKEAAGGTVRLQEEDPEKSDPKNSVGEQEASQAKEERPRAPTPETETADQASGSVIVVESRRKTSPPKPCKKGRSHQSQDGSRRKKRSEEVSRLDKWTEKKFDFLKRAEETKAAEILRHEEEKKRIFDRRLSLQQGKVSRCSADKADERKHRPGVESLAENLPRERVAPFDENSQSDSPEGSGEISDLPTSEYRRNKFLDYSEGKVVANGGSCDDGRESEGAPQPGAQGGLLHSSEKKADVKSEGELPKEAFSDAAEIKEEIDFQYGQMDDILKKMSEINFLGSDPKSEEGGHAKRERATSQSKKSKKSRKLELEKEEKLTVENISTSKPTIKFSIQKSHDLKISLKVLNSSKKYENSDEEVGSGETEAMGDSEGRDDSENSTELITLKYKSIQRESPSCDLELKKNRRRLRRKKTKESADMKTPVLKIKKNRCLPQEGEEEREERDPLAVDAVCLNLSKRTCPEEHYAADDFQVQETVDSAKIKLTFKRHKGNFETEYKINNAVVGKVPKEEAEETLAREPDGCAETAGVAEGLFRDDLLFDEPGVDPLGFAQPSDAASDLEDESGAGNSTREVKSEDPGSPQEWAGHPGDELPASPGYPSSVVRLSPSRETGGESPPREGGDPDERQEEPTGDAEEDPRESGREEVESDRGAAGCDGVLGSGTKASESCDATSAPADVLGGGESFDDLEKAEIEEISLEFLGNTNSPGEIETNDAEGKAEGSDAGRETAFEMQDDGFWDEGTDFSTNDINHSTVDSSYESKSEWRDRDEPLVPGTPPGNGENEGRRDSVWEDFVEGADTPKEEGAFDFVVPDKCPGQLERPSQVSEQEGRDSNVSDASPVLESEAEKPELSEESETTRLSSECPAGDGVGLGITSDIEAPANDETELEEGEIVDDDDEEPDADPKPIDDSEAAVIGRPPKEFKMNKIQRRHSLGTGGDTESQPRGRKFAKAGSCPPEWRPSNEVPGQPAEFNISVADIPLPPGDPPPENCFDFAKYFREKASFPETEEPAETEATKTPESGSTPANSRSSLEPSAGQTPGSSSPPPSVNASAVDILQRSSKIKFSIQKRTKLHPVFSEPEKPQDKSAAGIRKADPVDEATEAKSASEGEPKAAEETGAPEKPPPEPKQAEAEVVEERRGKSPERRGEEVTPEEDADVVSPNAEAMEVMSFDSGNFIRDEFYECEDIPTSEDLPNGMEVEKVPDDDKFRNMMQNCLDNAKKFLNVSNLKLFSCSVDDLLELDCQLEEQEPEKSTTESANHISRDVLLASCEDPTPDDLGLSEKFQPGDISMDFLPSFSSDVCPEILPVDNWPYLEEEVPASPTKSRQEENDLILETGACSEPTPSEDAAPSQSGSANAGGRDRSKARRAFAPGIENGSFRRFRRRSLVADGEAFRMCSKINVQRRKTVDGFGGNLLPYPKDRDLKSEIARLKNGIDKMENLLLNNNSLKCRLSLEKITKTEEKHRFRSSDLECSPKVDVVTGDISLTRTPSKRKYSLDYKSSIWQPKVMLFRISKKELKKVYRHSKTQRRSESGDSKTSSEAASNPDACSKLPHKRRKCEDPAPAGNAKPQEQREEEEEEEKESLRPSGINMIKGSLSAVTATSDVWKRKKSRFRNLHTKKKSGRSSREVKSPCRIVAPEAPALVDAENIRLSELFQDAHPAQEPNMSISHGRSAKEATRGVRMDEKLGKSSSGESRKSCWGSDKETRPRSRSKEDSAKHRSRDDNSERRHDHRGRDHRKSRREAGERTSHCRQTTNDRAGEEGSRRGKHGKSRHGDRSPHGRRHARREGSLRREERPGSGEREKEKSRKRDATPEPAWVCQVCGFNDPNERVSHIKNHPFHCQSCHLAFKTEAYFIDHLTNKHKDIRSQHHCLLCELSFDTGDEYHRHLQTREHKHLESVEKNTINTLFTLLTGRPCPVLGIVEMKPEWLPNQAGTVHFYHQATPLSLALQYLKMHHSLSSCPTASPAHPD